MRCSLDSFAVGTPVAASGEGKEDAVGDEAKSNSSSFVAFWTTLPGILTGAAGLLTAIATVLAVVLSGGNAGRGQTDTAGASVGYTPPAVASEPLVITVDQTRTAVAPPVWPSVSEWATSANAICDDESAQIEALGNAATFDRRMEQLLARIRIITHGDARIQALPRPDDSRAENEIVRMLRSSAQGTTVAAQLYEAWLTGDSAAGATLTKRYVQLEQEVQRLDIDLGANVCAQPS